MRSSFLCGVSGSEQGQLLSPKVAQICASRYPLELFLWVGTGSAASHKPRQEQHHLPEQDQPAIDGKGGTLMMDYGRQVRYLGKLGTVM